MNSLPPVTDPGFRQKLREAREARGLTQYKLAKIAGIAGVMPSRYEDASHHYATLPNTDTWAKLNRALFPESQDATVGRVSLQDATTDDIVAELKRRGATSIVIGW